MATCTIARTSKYAMPRDGKTPIGFAFWNFINELIIVQHFRQVEVVGAENIPNDGPFILIANHSKRWDGPVVQYLLNRRANYMVSPNEMKGLQGAAVMSVGAFPANPKLDPIGYAIKQLRAGEPVVVFPEGNVFYDGEVHTFKTGVAKIALNMASALNPVKVLPMYIEYGTDKERTVKMIVGSALDMTEEKRIENERDAQRALANKMRDAVVALRDGQPRERQLGIERERFHAIR